MENVPLLIYVLSPFVGIIVSIVVGKFVINWWFDLDLKKRNEEKIITLLNEISEKLGGAIPYTDNENKEQQPSVSEQDLIELPKKI